MVDLDELAAFNHAVGHILRTHRLRRSWSLANVSAQLGIAESTISRFELGQRTVDMDQLVGWCWVLGPPPVDVIALAQAEAFPLGWRPAR